MKVQTQQIQDLMKAALIEARRTFERLQKGRVDVPVGCLILKDGNVIAQSHNQREENQDPTAHAELLAIREASSVLKSWRLSGCLLVVTLEPCPMCAEAIIQSRISTVVFGAYDQRTGACGSAFNLFVAGRSYPLPEIIGGIEEEECERLLAEFFKTVRSDPH